MKKRTSKAFKVGSRTLKKGWKFAKGGRPVKAKKR